jgi:hypothetical protein
MAWGRDIYILLDGLTGRRGREHTVDKGIGGETVTDRVLREICRRGRSTGIDIVVPVRFSAPNARAPIQLRGCRRLHLLDNLVARALNPPRLLRFRM